MKKYDERSRLEFMFDDLGVGELDEIDKLTDDELSKLILDIKDLYVKYPGGVEDPDFMDELEDIVNGYLPD